MKRKLLIYSVLSVCFIIVGILLGKSHVSWPFLSLKTEVDLVAAFSTIISIIVTIIAAYWVAKILDKENQESRIEKDLIIKRTEDVYLLIDNFSTKLISREVNYVEAVSTLKRVNTNVSSINKIVEETSINLNGSITTEIAPVINGIRNLLTNTPALRPDDPPIEVLDGIIHISINRLAEVDMEFDKLKGAILKLQLLINKN